MRTKIVRNERFALDSAGFEKLHLRGMGAAFPGSWLPLAYFTDAYLSAIPGLPSVMLSSLITLAVGDLKKRGFRDD